MVVVKERTSECVVDSNEVDNVVLYKEGGTGNQALGRG